MGVLVGVANTNNTNTLKYQSFKYSGSDNFQLNDIISDPQQLQLYINGYKSVLGKDFVVNNSTISWMAFFLEESDFIEVYYV